MLYDAFTTFLDVFQVDELIFYYQGPFSQEVIVTLSASLKQQLQVLHTQNNTARKIFSAYIETMQNLLKYSNDHEGAVVVCSKGDRYYIISANLLDKTEEASLRSTLDSIAEMSPEDVKKAYLEQLKNGNINGLEGAGLGFLTMARNSKQANQYAFADAHDNGQHVYFYFKATL